MQGFAEAKPFVIFNLTILVSLSKEPSTRAIYESLMRLYIARLNRSIRWIFWEHGLQDIELARDIKLFITFTH